MKFIKNNELLDAEILKVLKEAATDYEDGAIAEARNALVDIVRAIDEFTEHYIV
jgi:hypothetical protein